MSPVSLLAIARGCYRLLLLVLEVAPLVLKLWRDWQRSKGQVSRADRRRISAAVRKTVKEKNTEDLEGFLTKKPVPEMESKP